MRVNIIDPRALADQHLVAEYAEILMLAAYVRDYPEETNIPQQYCLGTGHIRFFKNKLLYLKKRHETIKKEMKCRGFAINKNVSLSRFPKKLCTDWKPSLQDKQIIKKRLIEKLKKKPAFYRYYGKHKPLSFFVNLIKNA